MTLAVGPIKKQKLAILVAIENKNNGRKTSDLFMYSEIIRGLKMTRNLLIGATIITIPFIALLLPTLYCGWKTFQYLKLVSSIPNKNDMRSYLLREGFSPEEDVN